MSYSIGKLVSAFSIGMLMTVATGAAQAMPFNYSESVSGDLTSAPNTGFMFDMGNNTISGTTHFGVNTPGHPHYDSDFDGFAFTLPTQMRLASISLAFVTNSYNANKADYELRFCRGIDCGPNLVNLLGTQSVNFLDLPPPSIDFGAALPSDAGTYSVLTSGLGIGAIDPTNWQESWSADYTWTYTVVRVPEPGVLALFGLGFACLLVAKYLHRRARTPLILKQ